jgi:ribosomal protein S8
MLSRLIAVVVCYLVAVCYLQVLIRPSSKVIIKFLEVMQKHGELFSIRRRTRKSHPLTPPSLTPPLMQDISASLRSLTTTAAEKLSCSSMAASTNAA